MVGRGRLGVGALAVWQTRAHRDLDLLFDSDRFQEFLDLLDARGYVVETDWLLVRSVP